MRKGIITLTLVVSRSPVVTRGTFVMWLFKVKTQFQLQIEEYINWKSRYSTYAAKAHSEVLKDFCRKFHYKNVSEVLLSDIQNFYEDVSTNKTTFSAVKAMEAIRAFMRYFKTLHKINPKQITNKGIIQLQAVDRNDSIQAMSIKRPGRPFGNVELIKKVKRLRDKEGISFRKIGLVVNRDVSYVWRMYYYDLTKF